MPTTLKPIRSRRQPFAGAALLAILLAPLIALPGCLGPSRALPTAEELTPTVAATGNATTATAATADRPALSPGEFTRRETFRRGRETLLLSCAECHAVPYPDSHPAAEWPAIVEKMRKRSGVAPPAAADLTAYLQAASEQARTPRQP